MNTVEIKQMVINAHFAGAKFCQENKQRCISFDKEFIKMVDALNLPFPSKIANRIMKEWYTGYDVILSSLKIK
jgi:hypothetical protein